MKINNVLKLDQTSISAPNPVNLAASILLFMPSGGELAIIFFAVLLLFGGKKIPELMKGLGQGIREFNQAKDSVKKSFDEGIREAEREEQEKKRLAAIKAKEERQQLPQETQFGD